MPTTTHDSPLSGDRSTSPLDLLREELLALDPRELVPLNVDIAAAALTVVGAIPDILAHRAELVALCGEPMASSVDRLELVARAVLEAHAAHQAVQFGTDLGALSQEVVELRGVLLAEVRSLIARKVIAASVIRELRGAHGFKNQCVDVLQLVSILKSDWEAVGPETGLDLAYVDRAEAAVSALVAAVGARQQAPRSPSADLRQRAYSLMASTYDDARRMITFLRWKHGDADRVAPSFFHGRGNGRRRKSTPETPAAPLITNG